MFSLRPICVVCASLFVAVPPAWPQARRPAPPPLRAEVDALRQQVQQQQEALETMRRAMAEQDARYQQLLQAQEEQKRAQEAAARQQAEQQQRAREQQAQQAQQAVQQAQQQVEVQRAVQVGTAPPPSQVVVPQIFDEPSVLTPPGKFILEPSVQYGYSSTNRAALVGFSVIPAVLIGLIDVREVKRNTAVLALTTRYGLGQRAEVELRVPYVRRWDNTVSRELFTGTAIDRVFEAEGDGIGDVEVTGRYQLAAGDGKWPYLIGSLRLKTRTGKDPFEVVTDCVTRCLSNTTGTGQPLDLPVGTGFYALQPGLTWLYPSDPAVFFGSFTYSYNFERSGVSRRVLNGETEFLGDIKAGNVFGLNVGMGLALNDRSSFSIGVDMNTIGKTEQNGTPLPGSVRTTLASLVLGYSHMFDPTRVVHLSVNAGLTRDTPDFTLTLRMPFSF